MPKFETIVKKWLFLGVDQLFDLDNAGIHHVSSQLWRSSTFPKCFYHINQQTSSGAKHCSPRYTWQQSHSFNWPSAPRDQGASSSRPITLCGQQHLAAALAPSFPWHTTVTANSGWRRIRHTLQSREWRACDSCSGVSTTMNKSTQLSVLFTDAPVIIGMHRMLETL